MNLLVLGDFFVAEVLKVLGHRVTHGEKFLPPGAREVHPRTTPEELWP
jgi:hypothetical protein